MQKAKTHRRVNPQQAARRCLQRIHRFIGLGEIVENPLHPIKISAPGLREGQGSRGPMEQARAQIRFERTDMAADP